MQGSQNRLPDVPGQQEITVGQLQFLYSRPGGQPRSIAKTPGPLDV